MGPFSSRRPKNDDQGTAMFMVLIAMLVASSLSVLILGLLLAQVTPTQFERKNARTLTAAQAGIDAALGELRGATSVDIVSGDTYGDRNKLTCDPIEGTVGGQPGNPAYIVRVTYFSDDPSGQSDAWLATNQMDCNAGSGPPLAPNFGLIQSAGAADGVPGLSSTAGDRSLVTTYTFKLTNVNVSGGLIHNYDDGNGATKALCFDAHSDAPAAGSRLYLEDCDPGSADQLFAYRTDLSIVLAATQTVTPLTGMCVEAPQNASTAVVVPAVFAPCVSGTYSQVWSFDDSAHFQGSTPGGSLNGWCLRGQADNTAGTPVVLVHRSIDNTQSCNDGYNRRDTWRPEPKVGAGAAGAGTQQLVNYLEFGRCFDITGQNVNSAFMIAFPCKQAPNPADIAFNQRMVYNPTTQWLYTTKNGENRCLTTSTASPPYVKTPVCSLSNPLQRWSLIYDTGDYATSYVIHDSNGNCLGLGAPGSASAPLNQWSTIVSAPCTGEADQKWNAPPNLIDAVLKNTGETTAG